MVSSQIADAEGSDPYFVMRVSKGNAVSWSVFRRTGGAPVKSFDKSEDAHKWAAKKNPRKKR